MQSAARVVLHNALPSMQLAWLLIGATVAALARALIGVIFECALHACYAVARAAATVAPQPYLLVLPNAAVQATGQRAPAGVIAEAVGAPRLPLQPRGLLELPHDLLGVRALCARVAQRRHRLVDRS